MLPAMLTEPSTLARSKSSSPRRSLTLMLHAAFGLASLGLLGAGCATAPPAAALPEPQALSATAGLPDPLVTLAGQPVTTARQWNEIRRPELKRLFEHYVYGSLPPRPAQFKANLLGEHHDFLNGRATLKLVRLVCGPGAGPQIDLMVVVPNRRPASAPLFLVMNFCGNQAVTADDRVPLPRSWVPDRCPGVTNHHPTAAARGADAGNWPLEEIISRGYGFATFYHGDVDPDRPDVSEGIYAWLAGGDPNANRPADRGTIAAWAWGFHRCVDYLINDPDVDPKRIAAVGHSRNGKTALLAAAFDERIAMAFPHQAGCGGTAPSRGKVGESVKAINDRFPHWFNARFKAFNESPERLPVDQHELMALCAPRPLLISAAEQDQWANPAGQFEMARAATPVYKLLGASGIEDTSLPPLHQLVGGHLAYYLRAGRHSMTAADWQVFLQFADRHWQPATSRP